MSINKIQTNKRSVHAIDKKLASSLFFAKGAWLAPVLAFFVILLIYRRLLAGRVIATGDLETYFFPYWVAVSRSFRSGKLPFWTPYLFNGVPLLANSQVGVFYPLNWPFWFLTGNTLDGVAAALHTSVIVHVSLALLTMYFLARKIGLSKWAAVLSGFVYAGSGFVGIHVEHLNQLQALAWMPLVLLPVNKQSNDFLLPPPLSIIAMTMIIVAGHTQMAFISAVALVSWRLFCTFKFNLHQIRQAISNSQKLAVQQLFRVVKQWAFFLSPFLIAGMISAVQLLPTLELVNLSARQGGLDWREAVSFSLHPLKLAGTFLPPYISSPNFPESVSYVGGVALCFMGGGLWSIFRKRQTQYLPIALLAITGVALALGGYNPLYLIGVRGGIPGLKHFRAPVRFLALYVLSASLLAGLGFDYLCTQVARTNLFRNRTINHLPGAIILVICCADLVICAEWLPHASATIPRAYSDLRPATAHLISNTNLEQQGADVSGRFLSMSQMLFEVGDKKEIETIYESSVSEDALWAYLVSAKQREVLTPNLPLVFRIMAVDGYDGGLLPLAPYITFSHLLVEGGTQDGRLRENLVTIPDQRWMKLMNARYIVTDKVSDTWVDDILYDRQFNYSLSAGDTLTLAWLPAIYKADGMGLLYTGQGGQITIQFADGDTDIFQLPDMVENTPYRIRWENSAIVTSITLASHTNNISVMGISLINELTDSFYPLVLSDTYRLVHSGDVKIYEDVFPSNHTHYVSKCQTADTDSHALSMMSEQSFDPLDNLILDAEDTVTCQIYGEAVTAENTVENSSVRVLEYDNHEITIEVLIHEPGFIVVPDAWYPGWRARISNADHVDDTRTAPVLRANLMFRAVPVPAGHWYLNMDYQSQFFLSGLIITGIGIILLFLYFRHVWIKTRHVGI